MSHSDEPVSPAGPGQPASGAEPSSSPPARGGDTAVRPSPEGARDRNMLPARERRRFGFERLMVRLVATCGIVGIGVALGAILASSNVQGWIIGLVVAIVSVVLSAILWSSRQL
jgi:hypothetical protein